MAFSYYEIPMHRDPRGFVLEPLAGDRLKSQKNVHVVVSEPGAVRGNHYHREGTEIVAVVGPALVRVRLNGAVEDIQIPAGKTFCFTFPPGLSHAIRNTGTEPNLLVAFNSVTHTPENPDAFEDRLIEF